MQKCAAEDVQPGASERRQRIPRCLRALVLAGVLVACGRAHRDNDARTAGEASSVPNVTPDSARAGARVAAGSIDVTSYRQLDARDVDMLSLRQIGSIPLGLDSAGVPLDATDLASDGRTVFVLDGRRRRLHAVERSGRHGFSAGGWGTGPGQFSDPVRVALAGDTVFVLDVTHHDNLQLFDRRGQYLAGRGIATRTAPSTFRILGGDLALTTLFPDTVRGGAYFGVVAGMSGKPHAYGCRTDPRYDQSARRAGLIQTYRFADVGSASGRVLCVQPISPVVQSFDTSGRSPAVFRLAPPFYRPPRDTAMTTNDRATRFFESTWTAQDRIFARPDGFLSVYSTYDRKNERRDYWLFACRTRVEPVRCAASHAPGKPIRLLGSDTLVVQELSPTRDGEAQLTLYIVRP